MSDEQPKPPPKPAVIIQSPFAAPASMDPAAIRAARAQAKKEWKEAAENRRNQKRAHSRRYMANLRAQRREQAVGKPADALDEINLEVERKRLMNVLHRDVSKLLFRSADRHPTNRLTKDEATAVVSYLRLIKDLTKTDAEAEKNMTDEQLEEAARLAGEGSSEGPEQA